FVLECLVKASFGEPSCALDVIDRRILIALPPEQVHGFFNNVVIVEFAGPGHLGQILVGISLRAKYSSHRKNSRTVGSPSGEVHERGHHIKSCVNRLPASPSLVLSRCRPPKQTSAPVRLDVESPALYPIAKSGGQAGAA